MELLSARRLNDQTIGVVGLLDLNAGITAASLSAEGATSVDLLPLVQYNAPSGGSDPTGEQRWPGLWSASLYNPNGFGPTVSVQADLPGVSDCVEPALTVPATSPVHIQSIQAAGDNPDQNGLAVKVTTSDGSLPTVVLSRYQADSTGLDGAWIPILTTTLQADTNLFVPGEFVNPGENLYRVMVEGQAGVEDIDGFFAVPATTPLTTDETDKQRPQSLVFRDSARSVIGSTPVYLADYPEQLIVAIGAQEGGGTLPNRPGFSNIGGGIMQVTCVSGYQGFTQEGQFTKCPLEIYQQINPDITEDPYPGRPLTPGNYNETAESISFNLKDALALFESNYLKLRPLHGKRPPRGEQIIKDNNQNVDALITAVAYYNKGATFLNFYKEHPDESIYLGAVARQLLHNPSGGNSVSPLSMAEFLVDADYTAETSDLAQRLQCGQAQVDSFLQNSEFTGCE